MADPFNFDLFHQAAPAVQPAVRHVARCIPQIKTITHNIGVTTMTAVISTAVGVIVSGILGYFIGKRGLTGTKNDLNNAKNEAQKVVTAVETVAHPAPVA